MSKPQPPSREEFEVFYPVETRWADNDIYGHVNNVTYYAYFDSVINRHLIEQGGLDIHSGDTIGFIVESQCQYFAPVAFPDALTAGLRVTHLGKSSVAYNLALFKQDEPLACALGSMTHVFVSRDNKRPVAIQGLLRTALQMLIRD